jgi:NADPH:quinone reductase-like Zn-dependent oxidoreductase
LHSDGHLALDELELPRPGPGQALVQVHAAALTRDELEWPTDRLPAIPSYEISGVVAELGPDANGVAVGDEVYALLDFGRDGGAADYALADAVTLAPKPRALDHVHAAALPLAGLSAWQALFDHAALESGQRVIVTGANGGVGHLAVQLARTRGADVVDEDGGQEVDVIFDTTGGERLARVARALHEGGRLVSVAEEPQAEVAGSVRTMYFVVEPNRGELVELGRLADAGELDVAIDSVFGLDEAVSAFERLGQRGKHGKVVLRVRDA